MFCSPTCFLCWINVSQIQDGNGGFPTEWLRRYTSNQVPGVQSRFLPSPKIPHLHRRVSCCPPPSLHGSFQDITKIISYISRESDSYHFEGSTKHDRRFFKRDPVLFLEVDYCKVSKPQKAWSQAALSAAKKLSTGRQQNQGHQRP